MLKNLGDTWCGQPVWTYDVEDVGQEWNSELLKCAHSDCFYKFQTVYPDGLTCVNCPNCGRDTRIRPIKTAKEKIKLYNSGDIYPGQTPIEKGYNG